MLTPGPSFNDGVRGAEVLGADGESRVPPPAMLQQVLSDLGGA